MIIQDNIIKQYLKNVYFITGIPCGGKSSVSRLLAKKHGFILYDIDERFETHKKMSDSKIQKAMNMEFKNADEFYCRPYKEYANWLIDNTREQLDFVIMDLIRLSKDNIVVFDGHLTLEEASKLTDKEKVVFMLRYPSNVIEEYCNRYDHEGFKNYINSATDVNKAKENCNKTLEYINIKKYEDVKNSDYYWIEKDLSRSVEETVQMVEKYFNLV